jgi:short-subunit dehydrogenase
MGDMRTRDLVVVVTGASSGIGRATALAFAAKGSSLVLAARRETALEQVATECEARGGRALAVPTDVSDPVAVMELAARAMDAFGRVDVWVNNAAVTVWGPFQETPLEDFRRVLDVDVMGYVHGARAALPIMREQGRGVLVNVASVVGVVPQPYAHAYTMAKFAVRGLSGSLRQELRLERAPGVKVCTVLPATIDTPLFQHGANYTGRAVRAMPPVYAPERVARAIVRLVRRPRREVIVGPAGRGLWLQSKVTPGLVERLMADHVDRTHLSRDDSAPDTSGNLHQPSQDAGSVDGGWHGKRRTAVRRAGVLAAALTATLAGRRLRR